MSGIFPANPRRDLKIIVDEPDEKPSKDFLALGNTISNIIRNSEPHFTLGIYGEWGTGKTTLMKRIEKNLEEKGVGSNESKIITVWFNAWRYEREEQLATIALMKSIGYSMAEHIKFDEVSKTIFRGLRILSKDIVRQAAELLITEKGIEEFEKKLSQKINFLNQIEKETIYFDGLQAIKDQIRKVRRKKEDKDYRIVIFIDDLDRCSPKKALEVLESIKVFLDIEGFVYVIGLSHVTIDRLISYAYKEVGVEGKDYIQKIIQIPIRLPTWHQKDIIDLLENKIAKKLNNDYATLLTENSSTISQAVSNNPRQLKRFINNLIIVFETFLGSTPKEEFRLRTLLFSQILKFKFPIFYSKFIHDKQLREIFAYIAKYERRENMGVGARPAYKANEISMFLSYLQNPTTDDLKKQKETRRDLIRNIIRAQPSRSPSMSYSKILSEFLSEDWLFFSKFHRAISDTKDWDIYDKANEVVEEISHDKLV